MARGKSCLRQVPVLFLLHLIMTNRRQQKIFFIRHGKVDLPYRDHSEMPYEVLDDLATSTIDPGLDSTCEHLFSQVAEQLPVAEISTIYFNDSGYQSNRSEKSAQLIRGYIQRHFDRAVPLVGNSDLREVRFSVKALVTKERFQKEGMPAIRTALYQDQIDGRQSESIRELYTRINSIFTLLEKHRRLDETVLLVSHDFFMRVIDVYLNKTKKAAEVQLADLEKTALNSYFQGFGISYQLTHFKRFG